MARKTQTGNHRARPGLPPMFQGTGRRSLSALVGTGLAQALVGAASALALRSAFHSSTGMLVAAIAVLVVAAFALGSLRLAERVLAERMSQNYVHLVRTALLRASIQDSGGRSLGVTVARTTNDLTSLRNWMAFGLAPLASGIPLVLGVTVALAVLNPLFAVAAAFPLVALAWTLWRLTTVAYERSRRLRKLRGRLSAQIADTVLAAPAIRAGGGQSRELKRLRERSSAVVEAAVGRARVAGALRASAATATGLGTAAIVAVGVYASIPVGTIAAAVTVMGFLAAPVQDLGRVVEYRQMYRAARNILEPVLTGNPAAAHPVPRSGDSGRPADDAAVLEVDGVRLADGTAMAQLAAQHGARVVLGLDDRRVTTELMERIAGLRFPGPGALVRVAGQEPHRLDPRDRRRLVGYAGQGMWLERGTVSRALRYRTPDLEITSEALARFGLAETIKKLPRGQDTELRHGGSPLAVPERARVLLARALLGDPPLLLLDHLDADLGTPYLPVLRKLLQQYDGVVVLASDRPLDVISPTHVWTPLGMHPQRWRASQKPVTR
jgi:ABC-type multidrug transport system fused ATPase/permease subunit